MLNFLPTIPPRLASKVQGQTQTIPIPQNWEDFITHAQIRSAGKTGAVMASFTPFKYQKLVHYLSEKYPNLDIIKTRQTGLTTCVGGIFLHDISLNEACSSVCFMRNQTDTSNLAKRIRKMVDSLSQYITADNDNMGYLKLKNLGEIHFRNSSKEGCRSLDAVSNMLFDECAFVNEMGAIYSASSPSSALLGDNTKKICISTPGARSGFFWDKINTDNPKTHTDIQLICDQVAEGRLTCDGDKGMYWWESADGKTARLVIHFSAHPVYGQMGNTEYLAYRKSQEPGSSEEDIQREYNLKFLDAATAVFDPNIIEQCTYGVYENQRDPEAKYYLGIDTATTGADYVAAPVIKHKDNKYSLAFLYRKRNQTHQYHQYQISQLIKVFQPEYVGVEVTGGVGQVYLEKLEEMHPIAYFQAIRTTGDSKPVMVSLLLMALERNLLTYPKDERVISELLNFRRNGRKLEASEGKHDDIVMGLCFALAVTPFNKQREHSNLNIQLITS